MRKYSRVDASAVKSSRSAGCPFAVRKVRNLSVKLLKSVEGNDVIVALDITFQCLFRDLFAVADHVGTDDSGVLKMFARFDPHAVGDDRPVKARAVADSDIVPKDRVLQTRGSGDGAIAAE